MATQRITATFRALVVVTNKVGIASSPSTDPAWPPWIAESAEANGGPSSSLKGNPLTRHSRHMKVLLSLFLAVGLWADEAQDRAAIEKVIAAVNDPMQRPGLFTEGADSGVDFTRLIDLHARKASCPGDVIGMNETWAAMTVPQVGSGKVRFITPDVAIADGASIVHGAVSQIESVPLLFAMKRVGVGWRIDAVRVSGAVARPRGH